MINKKHIDKFILGIIGVVLIFTISIIVGWENEDVNTEKGISFGYEKIFNHDKILTVNIKVEEDAWNTMLKEATKEQYIPCDVEINGETYTNVGIRPKGNTSLTQVASDSTTDRFSFKIEFDHYDKSQNCMGLDKLVLNNNIQDATYMKEYLSYDLLNYAGVVTPLYNYAFIKVNGEDWGFYLALEAMEKSFALRNFGKNYGQLYKPETMGVGGGMKQPINNQKDIKGGSIGSSNGASLQYTDDEIESYSTLFDAAVFKSSDDDYERVIKAIKMLNEGKNIEKYVDVDAVLRYIAVNTVLVNLDSYFSNMQHNYYLYEKDGQITMLPWDYNLSFAGFQSKEATSAVNFPIDTPVAQVALSERPMIAKLFEKEEYLEKYHDILKDIVDNYFNNGQFTNTIKKVNNTISSYVEKDASAFYTYEEYKTAVKNIKLFGLLRAQSIQGQLNGTIPSTTDGQSKDLSNLVDASSVNLEVMGTHDGGEMPPEGETPPGSQSPNRGMPPEGGAPPGGKSLNGGMPPDGEPPQNQIENPAGTPQKTVTIHTKQFDKVNQEKENTILYVGCIVLLIIALVIVRFFKRRKFRI